ncbi:MAG: MATE family efflux transporter [Clostridia bacterium]|nr:MATE family efflux transporter [Clostridia bacterium]MBQ8369759.1 MATE family efflux transporter [Clostridia bacterium]
MNILKKLVLPEYMVRESLRMGSDYPAGEMYRNFIRIAWPALMESVLIGLVSFVDSVMVSSVGETAVAAVGLTNQPRLLFYAIFLSLSIAVNAMVSRRFGEKDQRRANQVLSMVLPIAVILCAVFTVIAFAVSRPLLLFAGAQEDTIDLAIPYFRITMVGMNFTVISLIINAAQRGSGNTRISMTTNLSANLVNVVFNALLINGLLFFPKLGVTGAAIATMLGNMASAIISIRSVCVKGRFLRLEWREMFRWDLDQLKTVFSIGSGSLVEQVFMRFGFFSYAKLVAELGTTEFATHQIVMSIITLSFTVGDGLGVASSALVGQNLGRKRPDHSLIYGSIGQRFGMCISVLLVVLFTFGGGLLVGLFSDDAEIIAVGRHLLYIVAVTAPFQVSQVIYRGCLNGAGDTKFTAVVSFISIALVRPVLTYILCYPVGWGVYGAWVSLFIDQLTRFAFTAFRFNGDQWYKKKI